jgi:predicted AAA+ superfamily ATPase
VADKVEYSNELLGDILAKDILRDSKINEADFYKILDYILIHIGKSFSADSIINFYRSNNKTILSKPTIYSYIKKNTQAYLIIPNHRYDVKGKNVLQTLKKYYSVDPIIPLYRSNFNTSNLPFLLENIIFIELLSRGYTVFSGKMTNYEIDFVVFKGIEKCYIQVSYLLSSEDTMKREKRPLLFVGDNCPKYIFSLDAINMTSDGIVHINIIDFLLYKKDITLL